MGVNGNLFVLVVVVVVVVVVVTSLLNGLLA